MTRGVRGVTVEACVDSLESAVAAARGGADRLELCADLAVGGTTPSLELFDAVRERVSIPIHVMIRPRGGVFVHGDAELDVMRRAVDTFVDAGADGIVTGILTADDRIDVKRTRELVARAGALPVTFHRAFDFVPHQSDALEALSECGVRRVLTGGGPSTAIEGLDRLAELVGLVERAGDRLAVMAGGHVRGDKVARIVARTGVREVHARCELDAGRIADLKRALAE